MPMIVAEQKYKEQKLRFPRNSPEQADREASLFSVTDESNQRSPISHLAISCNAGSGSIHKILQLQWCGQSKDAKKVDPLSWIVWGHSNLSFLSSHFYHWVLSPSTENPTLRLHLQKIKTMKTLGDSLMQCFSKTLPDQHYHSYYKYLLFSFVILKRKW